MCATAPVAQNGEKGDEEEKREEEEENTNMEMEPWIPDRQKILLGWWRMLWEEGGCCN